jgi:hypothetical protein
MSSIALAKEDILRRHVNRQTSAVAKAVVGRTDDQDGLGLKIPVLAGF